MVPVMSQSSVVSSLLSMVSGGCFIWGMGVILRVLTTLRNRFNMFQPPSLKVLSCQSFNLFADLQPDQIWPNHTKAPCTLPKVNDKAIIYIYIYHGNLFWQGDRSADVFLPAKPPQNLLPSVWVPSFSSSAHCLALSIWWIRSAPCRVCCALCNFTGWWFQHVRCNPAYPLTCSNPCAGFKFYTFLNLN